MKTFLTTIAVATMFSAPAFAFGSGNITGTENRGEPLNATVHSPAKNPASGLTPGGEASYGKAYVKQRKHQRVIHPAGTVVTRPGY